MATRPRSGTIVKNHIQSRYKLWLNLLFFICSEYDTSLKNFNITERILYLLLQISLIIGKLPGKFRADPKSDLLIFYQMNSSKCDHACYVQSPIAFLAVAFIINTVSTGIWSGNIMMIRMTALSPSCFRKTKPLCSHFRLFRSIHLFLLIQK